MEIRTRYGARVPVIAEVGKESRAKQAEKDSCDINVIMKRYQKTGMLPAGVGNARYGDFSGAGDYQSAQEVILRANAQFNALPSKVRERFNNDPRSFLAFVNDKSNFEEARVLGLLKEEDKPVVPVVPTTIAVDKTPGNVVK